MTFWNSLVASLGLSNELSAPPSAPPIPSTSESSTAAPPDDLLASLGLSMEDIQAVQPGATVHEEDPSAALLASMGLTNDDVANVAHRDDIAIDTQTTAAALKSLQSILGQEGEEGMEWEDVQDEDLLDPTLAREGLFSEDEDEDEFDRIPEDWDDLSEGLQEEEDTKKLGTVRKEFFRDVTGRREMVYLCPNEGCKHKFRKLSNLVKHQHKHFEEKPYICSVCSTHFSSNIELKRHIQSHVPRSYTCQACHKIFTRLDALKRHKANPKSEISCQKVDIKVDEVAERKARNEAKRLLKASVTPSVAPLPASAVKTTATSKTSNAKQSLLAMTPGRLALQSAHIVSILTRMIKELPREKISPLTGSVSVTNEDDDGKMVEAIGEVLEGIKLPLEHAKALRQVLGTVQEIHSVSKPLTTT